MSVFRVCNKRKSSDSGDKRETDIIQRCRHKPRLRLVKLRLLRDKVIAQERVQDFAHYCTKWEHLMKNLNMPFSF